MRATEKEEECFEVKVEAFCCHFIDFDNGTEENTNRAHMHINITTPGKKHIL